MRSERAPPAFRMQPTPEYERDHGINYIKFAQTREAQSSVALDGQTQSAPPKRSFIAAAEWDAARDTLGLSEQDWRDALNAWGIAGTAHMLGVRKGHVERVAGALGLRQGKGNYTTHDASPELEARLVTLHGAWRRAAEEIVENRRRNGIKMPGNRRGAAVKKEPTMTAGQFIERAITERRKRINALEVEHTSLNAEIEKLQRALEALS